MKVIKKFQIKDWTDINKKEVKLQVNFKIDFRWGEEGFPGGLVVRILGFHCHSASSIPGQGTEIPQAAQCRGKNIYIYISIIYKII